MSIFDFFKKKGLKYNMGLADDPRSQEEKDRDFTHDEIAGSVILDWKEKPQKEWKKYKERWQDGSLSCCGQSAAKADEILFGQVYSAHPIYRSRVNFPQGGMWLGDVGNIAKKIGTTTEFLDPSQWQDEATMNRPITVQTPVKVAGYVMVKNPTNIEAIAEAIELYKHCLMIVHCNKKEWNFVPSYLESLPIDFGHCVCGVDYIIHNGEKAIVIEDSTGNHNSKDGQRIITESFLKKRFDGAMYFLPTVPPPPPPTYKIVPTIKYGMTGTNVVQLQEFLKSKGFFPASVPSTGKFFNITKKAVMDFQKKNPPLKVDGIVGPKTAEVMNK